MEKKYIPIRLAFLTMLMLIAFFAGCTRSHVPVPEKPVAYSQEKAQAADHWRGIAVDVADKIRDALVERNDIAAKPLYVIPPNNRPFMVAFHQLIKTELVSRGIQVAEEREQDSIQVECDVLTVLHDNSRFDGGIYGYLADMGIGLSRFFSGASGSDHEIVVNARMSYNNRYVVHRSYIRYINDADWPLYINPEKVDWSNGANRVVRVTNR